ncbi:competence type IV pilus major pilin ComGC [Mechercharimyces sp. CAU 1602]|uniref:competence type IV pilus major pilin ComGC n=1 Tax=Mechercharimyces sp. CAU 1602 TaxID=2973933 RepID=UPI002162BF21|nr:prepilin-type N-terminal cleavage/methylation domain-containing protein [Mechercharimyces sp. CAU 1602]MCS1350544.1 prepilin-type N-terminal cleavage/methylation domain-containing protein [Mechercharimyces sp. CAU 1602]
MQAWRDERGFTLIEMLVVLFIIGVVIAIALPNLISAGEKAQQRACAASRKMIGAQADNYFLEMGKYPATVAALTEAQYLRSTPTCPAGGKYTIDTGAVSEKRVVCTKHPHKE